MALGNGKLRAPDVALAIAVFLDLVGFGMVIADMQLRIERLVPRGWPPGLIVGGVLASTFVVQIALTPVWGRMSDRVGRKPFIVGLTALSGLSMLIYALAPSAGWLLVSRMVAGAASANVAIAQAYVADIATSDRRSVVLGRIGAAISAGLVVGPAIGGQIVARWGQTAMGMSAAIASLVGAVVVMIALPTATPLPPAEERKSTALNLGLFRDVPRLAPVAIVSGVAWFSLAMLEGTFARLIHRLYGMNQREFGFLFGFESLLAVFVQTVLIGALAKRFSDRRVIAVAYALQGVGLALNPLAGIGSPVVAPIALLIVASAIYAIGSGVANPTVNGLMSELCPADRQGELFGALQSVRSVGFVIGPTLGGLLFDAHPAAPYFVAGGVCLGACALVTRIVPASPLVACDSPSA